MIVFKAVRYDKFRLVVITSVNFFIYHLTHSQAIKLNALQQRLGHTKTSENREQTGPISQILKFGEMGDKILHQVLPSQFLRDINDIYGDEIYWWVEARDAQDQITAHSGLMNFRIEFLVIFKKKVMVYSQAIHRRSKRAMNCATTNRMYSLILKIT